jgi:fucose permease
MGIIPQFNSTNKRHSNKRTVCFLLIVVYAIIAGLFAPQPLPWYYYIIPATLFVVGIKYSIPSREEKQDGHKL